jgi:hypothetical protein
MTAIQDFFPKLKSIAEDKNEPVQHSPLMPIGKTEPFPVHPSPPPSRSWRDDQPDEEILLFRDVRKGRLDSEINKVRSTRHSLWEIPRIPHLEL